MLKVDDLCVGYQGATIVDRVSIEVSAGEVVSVLGPNGSGKTTLMRAVAGIIDEYGGSTRGGRVHFLSEEITGMPAHVLARLGLLFVPEGGRVFPSLSVLDNLKMAVTAARHTGRTKNGLEQVLGVFPELDVILLESSVMSLAQLRRPIDAPPPLPAAPPSPPQPPMPPAPPLAPKHSDVHLLAPPPPPPWPG